MSYRSRLGEFSFRPSMVIFRDRQKIARLSRLKRGSEVAIVPLPNSPPHEAEELATVHRIWPKLIELTDGRFYATNGKAYSLASLGYLVPATDKHRIAVLEREFSYH